MPGIESWLSDLLPVSLFRGITDRVMEKIVTKVLRL
jgi:hypothetical protein